MSKATNRVRDIIRGIEGCSNLDVIATPYCHLGNPVGGFQIRTENGSKIDCQVLGYRETADESDHAAKKTFNVKRDIVIEEINSRLRMQVTPPIKEILEDNLRLREERDELKGKLHEAEMRLKHKFQSWLIELRNRIENEIG